MMKLPAAFTKRGPVGIVVGSHDAVALLGAPGARPVARSGFPDSAAALAALLEDRNIARAAVRRGVRIALLPPLVDDRVVLMPRLTAGQAERALTVRADRHFGNAPDDPVVAASVVDSASGRVLASCAASDVIARIHEPLRRSGVRCAGVFPALAAIVRAGSVDRSTAIVYAGMLVIAVRTEGRIVALRRVPAGSMSAAAALADADLTETDPRLSNDNDVGVRAAQAVAVGGMAEFRPPALRLARMRRARLRAGVMAAGAVTAIALALGIEAWSIERDLRGVQAQRSALRDEAGLALRDRERHDDLVASLDSMAAAAAAPAVHELVEQTLAVLPAGVQLDVLEIGNGELIVSGTAARADAVYAGVRSLPWTDTVEWIGPVTGRNENGIRRESFGIAAVLTSDSAAP